MIKTFIFEGTMLFNATVEPLQQYLNTVEDVYDKKISKTIRIKFDYLNSHISKNWSLKADSIIRTLYKNVGGLKANIMVDKYGLFKDLRDYAKKLQRMLIKESDTKLSAPPFAHLINQGDLDGIFLPFKFSKPILINIPGRSYPFPIGSSVTLENELKLLNKHLKVEKSFKITHLPNFIEAPSDQIDKFEKESEIDLSFWIKFGFVVLRSLNEIARENKLPIIFHYT